MSFVETFQFGFLVCLLFLLLGSIIKRYLWHRILAVALCLACVGATVFQLDSVADKLNPSLLLTALFVYLIIKWVVRGNIATVAVIVLASFVQYEASNMLSTGNTYLQLNGALLLIPAVIGLVVGAVLYTRGLKDFAAQKAALETAPADDILQAG